MFKTNRQRKKRTRVDIFHHDIPAKANRILHVILIGIFLIIFRVWHLSVIQYDEKLQESQKPQRKVIIEPAIRATIRDRFNLPLAINKISYQATILYAQLRNIPSIEWRKDENGQKIKIFKRKEYIRQLSEFLGEALGLDADRIEDLIHAKASYYSNVPFVIKSDISEKEYYLLKGLEKDWPGIHMRHLPQRYYPRGRVAGDIIGYMGAINRPQFEKILHEIKALEHFIHAHENDLEVDPPKGIETLAQAQKRLKDLKEKAYTIHDYVGKTGIEGTFEEQLRGFYGKKIYEADSKGHFLRELPGSRAPLSGHRILLTISAELQEYAESLLAQNEELRPVRKSKLTGPKNTVLTDKEPWIKGGAIVVMEPHTGEILTLASYPRFNPNDFIFCGSSEEKREKKSQIQRWFENEAYIAQIWNLQKPYERERFNESEKKFYEEKIWLTWNRYLDFILPHDGIVRQTLDQLYKIKDIVSLQRHIESLQSLLPEVDLYTIFNFLYTGEKHEPYRQNLKGKEKEAFLLRMDELKPVLNPIKEGLNPYLNHIEKNYDKVLVVDLCRLALNEERFSENLLNIKGQEKIENYRLQSGSFVTVHEFVKERLKELYHDIDFKEWRKQEEKEFLKNKRLEEKNAKIYPKPYLDYLDQQESQFFQDFWNAYRWEFVLTFLTGKQSTNIDLYQENLKPYLTYFTQWYNELKEGAHQSVKWKSDYDTLHFSIKNLPTELATSYLQSFRSFDELTRPLFGRYRSIRQAAPLEKHLAASFYPVYGFGCGRSHGYRQAAIQGSLFKLVLAYEALIQRFQKMGSQIVTPKDLNPLVIVDQVYQHGNTRYVGYTEDGKPIPQLYKGGRLPRSLAHQNNGRVDLIRALEVSSNPYFSLLAGECLENPDDLSKVAKLFSFGERTGIDLPMEIPGKVPTDLAENRTGLYAMAIGQHSLVVTPLQTAVMLSAIANGGKVLKPKIVRLTAGKEPLREENQQLLSKTNKSRSNKILGGIDSSLLTNLNLTSNSKENLINTIPTEVKRTLLMPETIRQMLLKGLKAATHRTHLENLSSLVQLYKEHPKAIKDFTELKNQLFGKTSTSESVENIDLDLDDGTNIYTHVWFGSIAFSPHDEKNKAFLLLKDEFGHPELVVVVYLRYGGYGKEAAPLAAQIVKKWREIKAKHGQF
ncbi:MAG: penicillin-binding transpeptidase domain-containing protein [Parachlamydiaceae bacterium]|nr:penicillin-binding transpeptidase domain-containing protein [Parachlamydiaceae bacterium]